MNSTVSVVVPIYNVEKYLENCVHSLVNQTYKNLEIILVDDGATDSSPQICDKLANEDKRITVVHKKNGGLSDARNAGIIHATGDYICYIDSDDSVSFDFIETLLKVMESEESDIVECDLIKVYENQPVVPDNSKDYSIATYNTAEALDLLIADKALHQHVWNKLYKASVAKNILFEKGKTNEDEFWTYQVFGNARKITKIDKGMYYYLQRSTSIMGVGYNIKRLDALQAKLNRQKYIDTHFPELSSKSKISLYTSCIYAYQMSLKYLKEDKTEALHKILTIKNNCKPSNSDLKDINKKAAFWIRLSLVSFKLTCNIKNILGKGF